MEFRWNDFSVSSYEDLRPFVDELLARPVSSDADFRKWMTDYNYLGKWFWESFSRVSVEKDKYSTPENFQKFQDLEQNAYMPFVSAGNKLEKRIAALAKTYNPRIPGFDGYLKRLENSLAIFREENVPLQKSLAEASNRFFKLQNTMKIEVDGKTISFAAATDLLRGFDRVKRKEVFEKLAAAEAVIADEADGILSEIIGLRKQMATNAGFDSTLEYLTKKIDRLDYDIATTKQLYQSVKKLFVPLFAQMNAHKKEKFGYDAIYPWDTLSDFNSFPEDSLYTDTDDFMQKILRTLDKINPVISGYFLDIQNAGNFDLEARLNKRGGAYQAGRPYTGIPFIFGNISPSVTQFRILFHEMGHALHTFLSAPLFFHEVNYCPMEVNELASQTLELISTDYYAEMITHNPDDQNKFRFEALKSSIMSIIFPCLQDEFASWLYENPEHSIEERRAKWQVLFKSYMPFVQTEGVKQLRYGYRSTPHFYFPERPLYHIEYAISMIGATDLYFKAKANQQAAIEKYMSALKLGYTVSIPELYKTAGTDFDFSEKALTGLAKLLETELQLVLPKAATAN